LKLKRKKLGKELTKNELEIYLAEGWQFIAHITKPKKY
jgi:hypothetical protein